MPQRVSGRRYAQAIFELALENGEVDKWAEDLALVAEVIGTIGGFGSSVFFVPLGNFYFDARCINMSLSLISGGYHVSVISTHKKPFSFTCLSKVNIIKIHLKTNGVLKYFQFYKKVNKALKNESFDVIISGDLYSLANSVKNKKRGHIIYDSREIYSALFAHQKKPLLRFVCSFYERCFLKHVDKVLVTAASDKKYLKKLSTDFSKANKDSK